MSLSRVCIVSEIFHPEDRGGQGRQAYDLAEALLDSGCQVRVLTRRHYSASPRSERVGRVQVDRLPPLGLTKGGGWRAIAPTLAFLWALLWKLARTARAYDVLIVHGVKAVVAPPLLIGALFSKRVIIKVDATAEIEQSITTESLARMGLTPTSRVVTLWTRARQFMLRHADGVIAISGEVRDALLRLGVPAGKIFELPNGIDLSRWHPVTAEQKQALRAQLRLPAGPLFCYVGRLSRAKGLLNLFEAWSTICAQHPDAHLLIIGTGVGSYDDCEEELHQRRARSPYANQITFTGQVENASDYLQASDVFVLCSESEGFGLSLVEAMACGLPCISTPVGAARDVIRSGTHGVLVPIGDNAALTAALQTMLRERSRWGALGMAARAVVTSRYDMRAVAGRYKQMVDDLVSGQRSPTPHPATAAAGRTTPLLPLAGEGGPQGRMRVRPHPAMKGNATWLIGCRVAADLLNLLLFILISRQFGPHGTGQYAYGFAIAGFLFAATTMGIDDYAIREYTRLKADVRSRLLQEVLGTQVCVTLLALLALGVYLLASHPDQATLWCILALTVYQLSNAVSTTLFVPAMAEQQMVTPALSFLASRSLAFIVAGILILKGSDLPMALIAFAASGLVILVLATRSAQSHGHVVRVHISKQAVRTQTTAMWSFASIDLLTQVLARISVIALTLLSGGAVAGLYATGLKLIEAMLLPLHFIGAAAYPRLCRTFHSDPGEFRHLQNKLLMLAAATAVLSAAFMYWAVPWLLVPVFGQHYAMTQPIIASMAILAFVQAGEMMAGRIMLAADLQVQRAAIVAVSAIVCAVLNFALVWHFGIDAAIGATTFAYLGTCTLYIVMLYLRSSRAQCTSVALRELS